MKHTPGPWQWCHPDASASILHGAGEDPMCTGILIALGHEGCAERQGRNCALLSGPRRDADLALIAASPDLLAACKAYLAAIGGEDYGRTIDEAARASELIAAAVAKAEGRA